jgi:acyl-CoA thioester hydrolase
VHEKRIEVRWRDVDNYGHVNNAVYLTYLEEVRDEWLARTLRDDEAVWDYVVAHVSIDFRREVTQGDDEVVATCRAESVGRSSVRTRELIHIAAGPLAAEANAVLVARDRRTGRSRPMTDAERAAFESELAPATPAE